MKKILKTAGITLCAILLLLILLPFAFQGKIADILKTEGNRMLNAQFDFRSLDISLLRHFPSATVTLNDFWLKGVGEFENDTLVSARELGATVNLFSIFGNSGYDISRILMEDTKVHAIVLKDGRPNWDVMKPDTVAVTEAGEEEAESPFRVKLQKLSVDGLTLVYDDRQAGMYAAIEQLAATCSGDFGSERTLLRAQAETPALTFRMDGIPFLNRVGLKANMDVDADFVSNKYSFSQNSLQLNAIRTALDGWAALTDDGMDMDLQLNTNEVGFKELLSLVPGIYQQDFAGLQTSGNASLNAFARGSLKGDSIVPQFDVTLQVKEGMFRYPSLPAGVDGITILANVQNPGGPIDSTLISINPFNFSLAGNPFSLTADVKTPVSDLDFRAMARGRLDLGKVKEVYPLEDMTLNGVVDADMSLTGRLSYIEKEQYERMQAAGSIQLSDMKLQLAGMPDVDIHHSTFSFTPRYLQLSETTVALGDNDLTVDSRFENYLAYILKGSTLRGTLNISSNRLNLNDFMTGEEAEEEAVSDTTSMGIIHVPDNIDFRMQAALKQVLFDNMQLQDVNGLLVVKDSKVDMQNLSLRTMGGSVVVNGSYATPADSDPRLNAGFSLNQIGFAEAYRDLNMVRQLAPIFAGLQGNFSGSLRLDTSLDEAMSPVIPTLQGSGKLSTQDLELSGVAFIDQVADIVNKPDLKELRAKNLSLEFTIADGRVNTKPFDLKLGDYTMNLSGSTGLDQSIDYKGKITLPTSLGSVAKLGTVDMNIGGNFTSPKVSIDMESLAKNVAGQALQSLGDKLLGGQEEGTDEQEGEKKNVINKALDLFKKKK